MAEDIQKFKYRIDYEFNDISLLRRALTHRSYAAESNLDYDNQRLEFLGDAVLEIVLTDHLFKRYPEETEGCVTKMRAAMVQKGALTRLAKNIGISEFILLGRGEVESDGATRPSTMADAFEAILGALYLDGGLEAASGFLLPLIQKTFPNPFHLTKQVNPKGMLQEYVQRTKGRPPEYITMNIDGPPHDPIYHVKVITNCGVTTIGTGVNRKAAEFEAAKQALTELSKNDLELAKIFGTENDESSS